MSISKEKMNSIDYRKLDVDSYSSLKDFVTDSKKYYKKYVLKEPIKEDQSEALVMGSLVDCLLFSPQEYEMKFIESNTYELVKNKTHIADFAIKLWELTEMCLVDEEMTREFLEVAEEAYNATKFDSNGVAVKFLKKSLEQVLVDFNNSKEEEWYKLKRTGKTIINMQQKLQAERIIERLKTDDNTYELFFPNDKYIEVLDQEPLQFDLFGLPFKGMPDRVFVNHEKKLLIPYDLKCTWDIKNFDYRYLDNKYYIQAACYDHGLQARFPECKVVDPMKFLIADSGNHFRPLVYRLTYDDLQRAYIGFTVRGREYKGIREIAEDLLWAKENNIWNIERKDYENKSVRELNINYD